MSDYKMTGTGHENGCLPHFYYKSFFLFLFYISFLQGCVFLKNNNLTKQNNLFGEAGFVEVIQLDSSIHLDVRYASSNNFMGKALYKEGKVYLLKPVAQALIRVHKKLRKSGYGLLLFDGYRPFSITKRMWESVPPDKKQFVAPPDIGSPHNRGCAVDVSLFDLKTGQEVSMPCPYDEMSARASVYYRKGEKQSRLLRDLLRKTMEEESFSVYRKEWWHYEYNQCLECPVLDYPVN
jgi:zinc D-Ala-D-Ala dipeptidase